MNWPAAGQFKVQVSGINPSKKGDLLIQIDGKTVLKTAVKPGDTYAVSVPAGPHSIFVNSVGDDWFQVGAYLFSPYVSALKVYALQGPKTVAAWVENRNYNYASVQAHGKPKPVEGTLHFTGLAHNGTWEVQWWDTDKGIIASRATAKASHGKMDVAVPPTAWDWGLKMTYSGMTQAKGGETVHLKPKPKKE